MSLTPVLQHRRGCFRAVFSSFHCRLSSFQQRIYWLALPPLIIENLGGFFFAFFILILFFIFILYSILFYFLFLLLLLWEEQSSVKGQYPGNKHLSRAVHWALGAGLGSGTCTGTSSWWHRTSVTSSPGLMGNPIGLQLRKGWRGVRCPHGTKKPSAV